MLVGVQSEESLAGAGALCLVQLSHIPGQLVGVVGRRQLPCPTVLSLVLMSILMMSSK